MSARPTRKTRTARTPKHRAAATPLPPPMPPLVVAFGRLIDPDLDGISRDFERAWQAMPAVVDAYLKGQAYADGAMNASGLIGAMIDEEIEQSRTAEEPYSHSLADAIATLDQQNKELWSTAQWAVVEPAFQTGVALGLYLALYGGTR